MGPPLALFPPNPQRPELLLVEEPQRVADRNGLRRRIPALGQAPFALPAPPANHGHLSPEMQGVEHERHVPRAEPPMLPAPLDRPVLQLSPQQRASAFELPKDIPAERRVLLEELLAPPVPGVPGGPTVFPHPGLDQR